ncbi:homeobox KN domain-containing protein [Hamiltosporidium tvaerminnensis]|uniref:Homeobox KN domain-containing protein n=2 Tax=Hamiltosporidium TaxID=1176354 RepID=A0A4Q9L220_9MICR|nr:Homeobox protein tos8 [Hamiltosporidium tvaerminnensis]TBU01437.1 homeobox KN domain-containing protein [Hamiltosporidium tvaerminnensis]TBU02565.1 homeobox KN domain-containing protein [Hamiltosporidium magnivora]TBU12215.1 homeobox KN domain-containing protein [Hamiltosporidium tvaerminnensis]
MNVGSKELFAIIKKMAVIETKYTESSISNHELVNILKLLREEFEAISKTAEQKSPDEKYFVIFLIIILERLKKSIVLETELREIIEKEFQVYMDSLNEKLREVFKISHPYNGTFTYNRMYKEIKSNIHSKDESNRNKRSNYPKQISKVLQNWLRENVNNPYPTEAEKIVLSDKTGLDQTQINNWFINARRRLLPHMKNTHMKNNN